jgi:hypothetical protein
MLIIDFYLVSISSTLAMLSTLILVFKTRSSPLLETKFFQLSMLFFSFGLLFLIPVTLLSSPSQSHPLGVLFHRAIFPINLIAQLFLVAVLMFPTIQASYRSAMVIVGSVSIFTIAAITNMLTLEHSMSNSKLIVKYEPFSLIFLILSVIVLLMLIIFRIKEINSIIKKSKKQYISKQMVIILVILVCIVIFILVYSQIVDWVLPTFSWVVPTATALIFFNYAFIKNNNLFFVTTSSLKSVKIIENKTGSVLYSKPFDDKFKTDDLYLENMLATLNLSLNEIIESQKGLEFIAFGDIVVYISAKQFTSSFLILNESNLITSRLANTLSQEIEGEYIQHLNDFSYNEDIHAIEKNFEDIINKIRKFIPL